MARDSLFSLHMTKRELPSKRSRRLLPPSELVIGVEPEDLPPRQITVQFRAMLADGGELRPAGTARHDPRVLLRRRYLPRHVVRLFDATFLLSDYLFDEALGFFVAYVVLRSSGAAARTGVHRRIHPRLFYKDSSLMWRVASHFVHDASDYWIGKGDVRRRDVGKHEILESAEETANLPFEIQRALSVVSRRTPRKRDDKAVALVVRQAPSDRVEPYADFSAPRARAAARYAIHGDRSIARFGRRGDPGSLRFARGYEPDLPGGLVEEHHSQSRFFGGLLRTFRILSTNRRIQYLFYASPTHVWIQPPQTLTTELTTYGVRTLDVRAPADLCVPGYEYHEESSSQIPAGFAGPAHPKDPHRADASAWLEALPVVQEFRRHVLGERPQR